MSNNRLFIDKKEKDVKYQLATPMYANNSRDSSKFKGFSPLQLSCNLTGSGTQSAIIIILNVIFNL